MLVRVEVGAVMVRPMDCGRRTLCNIPTDSVVWVRCDEDLDGVLMI